MNEKENNNISSHCTTLPTLIKGKLQMKSADIKFENNTVYLPGPDEIQRYYIGHQDFAIMMLDALSHDFVKRPTGVPFDLSERMDNLRRELRNRFDVKVKPTPRPQPPCPNPNCAATHVPVVEKLEPDVDAIVLEMEPARWKNYLTMLADYHRAYTDQSQLVGDPQMMLDNKFHSILQLDNKTEHAFGKYLSYWDVDFGGGVKKTYIIWRFNDVKDFGFIRSTQLKYWVKLLTALTADMNIRGVGHDLQIPLVNFGAMHEILKKNLDMYNEHLRHMNVGYPVVYSFKPDGATPGFVAVHLKLNKPEKAKEQTA